MSKRYEPQNIEKKWQKIWQDEKAFAATDDYTKPKYYALVEFPYPSGQGLHVGHPRPYTALDIVARKRRMQGYNVLYPMGWDAFGLPTENYAIKNHIHPKIVTKNNVHHFKDQLQSLGYSFDWDREINTTDPEYYHWTQWIFLKLFKAGLAYKKEMPINWCTSCKVGLANEEVVNGVCERCGSPVVRKVKSEWMLKITEYADKLIDGLDGVDYIERVKTSQKNWIGRSHGAEVDFSLKDKPEKLTIYTTRPDTLFGVTYMVLSPEHPYIDQYKDEIKNWDEVCAYREMAARKSDFERSELAKDKTGVMIDGLSAVNPVNGKEIPIWISDYVLMSYGTGAIQLIDWKSVEQAGVASQQLKQLLIDTGVELGKIKKGAVTTGSFDNSLQKKWADREVMEKAFGKYAEFAEAVKAELDANPNKYHGQASLAIEAIADQYDEVTVKAFKAAQEAKSFSEAVDATKDAVSSGWMETFDILFGNYDEAKGFWSDLAEEFWNMFAGGAAGRNNWLKNAFDSGLDQLLGTEGFGEAGDNYTNLLQKALVNQGLLVSLPFNV